MLLCGKEVSFTNNVAKGWYLVLVLGTCIYVHIRYQGVLHRNAIDNERIANGFVMGLDINGLLSIAPYLVPLSTL